LNSIFSAVIGSPHEVIKNDGLVKSQKSLVLSFRAKREILVFQSIERPLSSFGVTRSDLLRIHQEYINNNVTVSIGANFPGRKNSQETVYTYTVCFCQGV
jgi:hypothetical protein